MLEYKLALLEVLLLQLVDQHLQDIVAQVLEVIDVAQLLLLPGLEFVLVSAQVVHQSFLNFGVVEAQLLEVVAGYFANLRVVLGLDGRSASVPCQVSNLAKELTGLQDFNESFLVIFIFDKALALALCYDEKFGCLVALLDLYFLWLGHNKLNFLADEVLNSALVVLEYRVALEGILEDEAYDFLFERRFDDGEELPQFILVIQSPLYVLEIGDDLALQGLWEVHVFHGCVCRVDLALKFGRLLV